VAGAIPWDQARSTAHLSEWWSNCLETYPPLLDRLRGRVAEWLSHPQKGDDAWPLATSLLRRPGNKAADKDPGYAALCGAIVLRLPLDPLDEEMSRGLACPVSALAPAAATRLKILKFLGDLEKRAAAADWSPATFPHSDPTWASDVAALDEADRQDVVKWCLRRFAVASGVTTVEHARGLVQMLRAAGMDSEGAIARAFSLLIKDRDAVTQVLAVTALARLALEGQHPDRGVPRMIGRIAEQWDAVTRKLLVEHLARRFGRRPDRHDERLRELCEEARLVEPSQGARAEGVGKENEKGQDGGLLRTGMRVLTGWFRGRRSEEGDAEKKP
jgi:hypothetical protein